MMNGGVGWVVMSKNYYDILGVSKNASTDEIKRSYRILAAQFHPDTPNGSEKRFKEINEAYRVLSNDGDRSEYDKTYEAHHEEQVNHVDSTIESVPQKQNFNFRWRWLLGALGISLVSLLLGMSNVSGSKIVSQPKVITKESLPSKIFQEASKAEPSPHAVNDAVTGKSFVSNQIIVEFKSGVSEQDSLDIIDAAGGKMLQRFTQAPLFLIEVEDSGDGKFVKNIILEFSGNPKIKSAQPNYLTAAN